MLAEFITKNLSLAAFIELATGLIVEMRDAEGTNSDLVFPDTELVRDAVKKFHQGGAVPAKQFSRRVSILKCRCLETRQRLATARANEAAAPSAGARNCSSQI